MQTAACAAVFCESRYYAKKQALYSTTTTCGSRQAEESARYHAQHISVVGVDRGTHRTVVRDAFQNFAIAVHLTQFALRFLMIATVNHQLIHYQTDAGADAESVFGQHWGLHKTPFKSWGCDKYMQAVFVTQAISLILKGIHHAAPFMEQPS
jgi:hypothetical protein